MRLERGTDITNTGHSCTTPLAVAPHCTWGGAKEAIEDEGTSDMVFESRGKTWKTLEECKRTSFMIYDCLWLSAVCPIIPAQIRLASLQHSRLTALFQNCCSALVLWSCWSFGNWSGKAPQVLTTISLGRKQSTCSVRLKGSSKIPSGINKVLQSLGLARMARCCGPRIEFAWQSLWWAKASRPSWGWWFLQTWCLQSLRPILLQLAIRSMPNSLKPVHNELVRNHGYLFAPSFSKWSTLWSVRCEPMLTAITFFGTNGIKSTCGSPFLGG